MSATDPGIIAARAEVERTRTRLLDTAHELQQRLNPKTLARDAWQGAKDKGADLAEDAVDAVRNRPIAAGGIAAALALFLAREPLKDLANKMFGEDDESATRSQMPGPSGEDLPPAPPNKAGKAAKSRKRAKPNQTESVG